MAHERRYVKPKGSHERWLTCEACQKRGYPAKADAKAVARRLDGKADVYRCPSRPGGAGLLYHVGHQSPHVTAGIVSRAELARRRRERTA